LASVEWKAYEEKRRRPPVPSLQGPSPPLLKDSYKGACFHHQWTRYRREEVVAACLFLYHYALMVIQMKLIIIIIIIIIIIEPPPR